MVRFNKGCLDRIHTENEESRILEVPYPFQLKVNAALQELALARKKTSVHVLRSKPEQEKLLVTGRGSHIYAHTHSQR